MCLVIIKLCNHTAFAHFRCPVDKGDTIAWSHKLWLLLMKRHSVCHENKIGYTDSGKLQNQVWKRSTVTSVNSCTAQGIYEDRDRVGYKEEWTTKNIQGNTDSVWQAFQCSPKRSTHTSARKLLLPHWTIKKFYTRALDCAMLTKCNSWATAINCKLDRILTWPAAIFLSQTVILL